jgi:chemotaxis protein MotB
VIGKGETIIIKKKKKGGHGGHHGGAWKVAYADFVTAMMAFFLVMWIISQSRSVKAAVAGYFREPGIFDQQKSNGVIPGGEMSLAPNQSRKEPEPDKLLEEQKKILEKAAQRIKGLLAQSPDLKGLQKQIEFQVTEEGLRIELVERDKPTFFASGSAQLAPGTDHVLSLIAHELGKLPNHVLVEGHTDSQPYASTTGYTNWELSADRANAARRTMEKNGLREKQMTGIRGFADTSLRIVGKPLDPRNRRVSVVVKHMWKESDLSAALQGAAEPSGPSGADAPAEATPTAAPAAAPSAAPHGAPAEKPAAKAAEAPAHGSAQH